MRGERRFGGNVSIEESITTKSYKNQPVALYSSEDSGTAFDWCELERPRIRACGVRVAKLAGQDGHLASSRTSEPGAYFELWVSGLGPCPLDLREPHLSRGLQARRSTEDAAGPSWPSRVTAPTL